MAANTYQSIKATDERPAINEGKSEDITEVRRELRSKGGPKTVTIREQRLNFRLEHRAA